MVSIKKEGVHLEATNLEFENQAVLNPACIKEGNNVHMFYRAVKQGNYSSIGYCKFEGPLKVVERAGSPILFPEFDYEKHGIEDPRIVFIDGIYYLTYMCYDGKNVTAAYATSKDLKKFEKHEKIFHLISYAELVRLLKGSKIEERYACLDKYCKSPTDTENDVFAWGKDIMLFPKKINGKFAMLHRILPDIQIIFFDNFSDLTAEYWKEHIKQLANYTILESKHWFELRHIGGGCPPIETDKGWLLIYHAVEESKEEGRVYRAGAALLDKKNPCKVIGRLNYPLFSPEDEWERKGDVDNVIFPTGAVVFDEKLYIYYGAADKRICVASLNLNELLDDLTTSQK
jgi:predicted GH43/DUF377 family glycosyl hydrolase